jgi:hypothetical protein
VNVRKIAPILLVTCVAVSLKSDVLLAESQPSWQECGESWATALDNDTSWSGDAPKVYEVTKNGIKKISHQKLGENVTLYGRVQLSNVTMTKNFTCYGFAEVSHSTIHGVTTMYGPMNADRCTFSDMDIRCANEVLDEPGVVNISNCSARKLFINGKLMSEASNIRSVTTFFHELEISNSHIGDITMMNGSQMKKKKAVIILNNTTVEGSIQFSQKGGTVILKGTSVIKGDVIGGTIEKIS